MSSKGLTLSVIFEAESANYGEGFGNIQVLKKMTRGDGNTYTYISRQALRYNITQQMGIDNTPVQAEGKGGVVQYQPLATIEDYPEIDLFGYMKTKKGKGKTAENTEDDGKGGASTRNAVVRLSNAISLEPYSADMDFLTNMGLAKRSNLMNNISQSEIHKSYYSYSLTIDLDDIGVDKNDDISLDTAEKAKRVNSLLSTVKKLYRDIKGRRENFSPVFAVGGLYEVKCPFFENRLKVSKNVLNVDAVQSNIEMAGKNSKVGYMNGTFNNEAEIAKLNPMKINEFFEALMKEVEEYYG